MALAKVKTAEEMARLDAIWAELDAHKDELEEPNPNTRSQAEIDEENRKAKIRRLSSLERKEFLGNVKSIAGNEGFKTKWEKILSQFILNNIAPMNEEIDKARMKYINDCEKACKEMSTKIATLETELEQHQADERRNQPAT